MSDQPIRSYRAASRHSCTPISSLRAAIARGDVPAPIIGADGKATFDVAALDALRAARNKPIAAAIAAPSAAPPIQPAAAVTVSSLTSAATAPMGAIPQSLLDAAERAIAAGAAAAADDDDDQDDDAPSHERPFWASGVTTTPTYPAGEPVGVCPTTRRIIYAPAAATASTHVPGTQGAQLQELQRQLVQVQAQLAQVCAEGERWRGAWRRERVAGIASAETLQASMGGASHDIVQAVGAAVYQAVAALSDVQLGDDQVTIGVANNAGERVAAWAAYDRYGRDGDDLARARARRRPTRRF